MEALAAFSIACNVIQTLDFGLKTCSKFNEIRKSGSLKAHDDIGKVSATLEALTGLLSQDLQKATPLDPKEQTICEVGAQCLDISRELQELLNSLKPVTKAGAIVSVIQSLLKKSRISELQERLREQWQVLQGGLLIELSDRLRKTGAQQTDRISSVDANVQILVDELANVKPYNWTIDLEKVAQLLSADGIETRQRIDDQAVWTRSHASDEHSKTRNEIRQVKDDVKNDFARIHDSSRPDLNEKIVQSLAFPEMTHRQQHIGDAHGKTYKWIFENSPRGGSSYSSDFRTWLEVGKGVYWINGKAGSGKSTLMNYVWQSPNRLDALGIWSQSMKLIVPAFFFWSPGTSLQKSSQGLLRALLCQILEYDRKLASSLVAQNGILALELARADRMVIWSETQLMTGLKSIIDAFPAKYCFFIDGLDEYDGDCNKLVNLILDLAKRDHVKVCVSSRPSRNLGQLFNGMPSLRLQDLTGKDIEEYVDDHFSADPLMGDLAVDYPTDVARLKKVIQERAYGVFLWVCLVVRDILTAHGDGCDLDELFPRLDALPTDLDELFTSMIGRIEKCDRPEASGYFKTMIAMTRLEERQHLFVPFALGNWARLKDSNAGSLFSISIAEAAKRCDSTTKRLTAATAGLLEISGKSSHIRSQSGKSATQLMFPTFEKASSHMGLKNWQTHVDFLHRTVFDYLVESNVPDWLRSAIDHDSIVCLGLSRAHMWFTIWAPTIFGRHSPGHIFEAFKESMNVVRHTDAYHGGGIETELLKTFLETVEDAAPILYGMDYSRIPKIHSTRGMYATCVSDLDGFAAAQAFRGYVLENLDRTLPRARSELASYFLLCVMERIFGFDTGPSYRSAIPEMIDALLGRGADVNRHSERYWAAKESLLDNSGRGPRPRSPWEVLVLHYLPELTQIAIEWSSLGQTMKSFLNAGADLGAYIELEVPLRMPYRTEHGEYNTRLTAVTFAVTSRYLLYRTIPFLSILPQGTPAHRKILSIYSVSDDGLQTRYEVSNLLSEKACTLIEDAPHGKKFMLSLINFDNQGVNYESRCSTGLLERYRQAFGSLLCGVDTQHFRHEDMEDFTLFHAYEAERESTQAGAADPHQQWFDPEETTSQASEGADPDSGYQKGGFVGTEEVFSSPGRQLLPGV